MIRITDPRFKYTNAASTDIRKTFKRILDQQRKAEQVRVLGGQRIVPIVKVAK